MRLVLLTHPLSHAYTYTHVPVPHATSSACNCPLLLLPLLLVVYARSSGSTCAMMMRIMSALLVWLRVCQWASKVRLCTLNSLVTVSRLPAPTPPALVEKALALTAKPALGPALSVPLGRRSCVGRRGQAVSCLEMKSRELQALWSRRSLLGCSIERVTGLAVDEGPEFQFGKRQIFFSSGDA